MDEVKKEKKATAFGKWYEKNKQSLSEKRKQRYNSDPAYRATQLERKRKQDEAKKSLRVPIDPIYTHTVAELATAVGVSEWTIRDWRAKGYYPSPYMHGRAHYFTDAQVNILTDFKEFLSGGSGVHRTAMEVSDKVSLIYLNWK
jgi:hypothetical protein